MILLGKFPTKLGTTHKNFVAATKNFAAATKRFVDRTKHFVVVTKYFCYLFKQMILLVYQNLFSRVVDQRNLLIKRNAFL